MGPLGVPELIIIFFVALLFFGPRKLPELGKSLGKFIGEFKRTSSDLRRTLDEEIRTEERNAAIKSPPPPVYPPVSSDSSDSSDIGPAESDTPPTYESPESRPVPRDTQLT